MSLNNPIRRYRTNPIEVGVLAIVALIFLNSVYQLLYSQNTFYPSALSPMNSNPTSEGRSLASVSEPLLTLEVPCSPTLEQNTQASRVRLKGQICGLSKVLDESDQKVKAQITNQVNQFQATIFT